MRELVGWAFVLTYVIGSLAVALFVVSILIKCILFVIS